ncbi:MAG: serine--tRNA ligase [Archaeoglobaceae archaeon]
MWSILRALREKPEILYDSQKRRNLSTGIVDKAIELDRKWREMLKEVNSLRKRRNELSKLLREQKDPKLVEEAKKVSEAVKNAEELLEKLERELESILLSIPNIAHDSVPIGKDDSENVAIRYWGKAKVYFEDVDRFLAITNQKADYEVVDHKPIGHADAVELFGWADVARAGKVAGSRFYYLFDDLVWLDFALSLYAIDFLVKNGFRIVIPPFMLRKEAYQGVTAFSDFEDVVYKIEGEDLHLIATSEHAIASMHMNETLEEGDLPLLYAGFSPCFRKEAGAHGKDTKGIFRVHQFNKVEQFVFCLPEQSWEWHEKLIENAEKLWQGLKIPYRVVNICTGDLGIVAAKKYDLEAWMPSQANYREMVSCSNCTDWQSYRLNIRYAEKKGMPSKGFVHTLNSTAIATTRAITAIIENYQLEDGRVEIPKALNRYLESFESAPKDFIEPKNARKV